MKCNDTNKVQVVKKLWSNLSVVEQRQLIHHFAVAHGRALDKHQWMEFLYFNLVKQPQLF